MKKRMLLISLALVLIVTTLMPLPVLAKPDKVPASPTSFNGAGLIFVTYMPDPVTQGHIWRYEDEVVEGFFSQCDWDLLAGAAFYSVHDSIVNVDDAGNADGIMKGTFTLTTADGILEGTFAGKISGNLFTGDIEDKGIIWRSTGGTGVFADVSAWGKWSAELHLGTIPGTGIPTLVGPIAWGGKYK